MLDELEDMPEETKLNLIAEWLNLPENQYAEKMKRYSPLELLRMVEVLPYLAAHRLKQRYA